MYVVCTVYDRIFGDFPAKNTVYTPYLYGSGKPYIRYFWQGNYHTYGHIWCVCTVLANPMFTVLRLVVLRINKQLLMPLAKSQAGK